MALFSHRTGIRPLSKAIQRESIDGDLRNALWTSFHDTFVKAYYHDTGDGAFPLSISERVGWLALCAVDEVLQSAERYQTRISKNHRPTSRRFLSSRMALGLRLFRVQCKAE